MSTITPRDEVFIRTTSKRFNYISRSELDYMFGIVIAVDRRITNHTLPGSYPGEPLTIVWVLVDYHAQMRVFGILAEHIVPAPKTRCPHVYNQSRTTGYRFGGRWDGPVHTLDITRAKCTRCGRIWVRTITEGDNES
jgi:hypothetical protein